RLKLVEQLGAVSIVGIDIIAQGRLQFAQRRIDGCTWVSAESAIYLSDEIRRSLIVRHDLGIGGGLSNDCVAHSMVGIICNAPLSRPVFRCVQNIAKRLFEG